MYQVPDLQTPYPGGSGVARQELGSRNPPSGGCRGRGGVGLRGAP